ncbi:hypothetical protein ERJ75_001666500 [Trypanosoma vivax]|nr:hypothetical protein ERJ75_001666500 [Trypanosoma vivax]
MYGCGALLFKDRGEVCVAGGVWDREPRCISQAEARAALLVLSSFAEATPKNWHICIDNATAMNTVMKVNAHSDALVHEPSLIDRVLQEQGVQTSWGYIASAEDAVDGIPRGNRLRNFGYHEGVAHAKGSTEDEVQSAFPLCPFVSHSFLERCSLVMNLCFRHCVALPN